MESQKVEYPTLLDDEPFSLLGYSVETMISRGDANTRERDYADELMLSRTHAVDASSLRKALEETADHRGTELTPLATVLNTLPDTRQRDWEAFVKRSGLSAALPESLAELVEQFTDFLDPMLGDDLSVACWNPAAHA